MLMVLRPNTERIREQLGLAKDRLKVLHVLNIFKSVLCDEFYLG